MKTDYTCKNEECQHDFEVSYSPECPASGQYGPVELYDPGQDAEVDPSECPKCGEEVSTEDVESDCMPDPDDYMEPDWE